MPSVRKQRNLIIFCALAAFALKLLLALRTYGTNDVYAYQAFAVWSHFFGADLYRVEPAFNHPPSMIHALRILYWLAQTTHLQFSFLLRLAGIVADAGTVWILYRMFEDRLTSVGTTIALLALAPIQILISGFHGNTDPVMIFFVVLSVWLVSREQIAAAGVAFGLAMCVKIVPVILIPVLFFALVTWRKRMSFFLSAGALLAAAWSPFLFRQPILVVRQVFGYKSSYGLWGLSWLMRAATQHWPALESTDRLFREHGSVLTVSLIVLVSLAMSRMNQPPSLYRQTGIVFLLFFTLTSGFAVQYLAWLTPWLVELGALPVALYMMAGTVFLVVVYNYWALGTPWYLTIAYPWFHLHYFQAACWFSVLLLGWIAWRRIRNLPAFLDHAGVAASGITLAVLALLLIPYAVVQMRRDAVSVTPAYSEDVVFETEANTYHDLAKALYQDHRSNDAAVAENRAVALDRDANRKFHELVAIDHEREQLWTPEEYMDASLDAYESGDYEKCVADATAALRYRPDGPAAWNNISLCQAQLGHVHEALLAAEETLRLDPDYNAVRPILEWARLRESQSR